MVNIKCKSLAILIIWWMIIGLVIASPLLAMDNVALTADTVENAGFQGAGAKGCNGGGGGGRPNGPRPTTATANATTAASG